MWNTQSLTTNVCGLYELNGSKIPMSLSLFIRVQLFATPWTAAHQASLSFTISWSLLKLMSIESVMPFNHLVLCLPFSSCLQSFPASGSFLMSWPFASGSQSIGVSASVSVLLMNIQDWFPLGLTGLISLQSKGLSRVFSNTTVQKHKFFSIQPSLWSNSHPYMTSEKTIALTIQTFVGKVMSYHTQFNFPPWAFLLQPCWVDSRGQYSSDPLKSGLD